MKQLFQFVLKQETARNASVVKNILRKKELIAASNKEHENIKTALIFEGGGMRGVYSGGVGIAFEQLGLKDVFDTVVGISSGAAGSAYFLAGQSAFGTSIYYEDISNRHFINPLRLANILNISYMENVFRKIKPLDQEAIRKSRSNLYIGVTEVATTKGVYLDMKQKPYRDIVTAVCASSSLPDVTKGPLTIDGVAYADGIIGCKNPLAFTIGKGATDIIVVFNHSLPNKESLPFSEWLLSPLLLRKYTTAFRSAYLARRKREGYDSEIIPDNINVGVICPEVMPLSELSIDKKMLEMVAAQANDQTLRLFSKDVL